nr:hypothetical protein [uncultured Cohaesibacter sp.]
MDKEELDKLVLRIEANTTQFNNALKKIEKNTATTMGRSEKSVVKFTSRLGGLGNAAKGAITAVGGFAGVAVGGGLAGLAALAKNSAEGISDLATEAERAGVSFEAFQELQYAASKSNVSIDALTDGLKELQLRADEFITTGSGSGADAFKRLGYSADDLKTRLKEPDKLFDDIIGRLQQFDKAAQIRIADEVFGGTGGEQFVQMIERGQKGLRDAREEAQKLGIVLEDDVAKRAQEINNKFETLSKVIGTNLKGAVVGIASKLSDVVDDFKEVNELSVQAQQRRMNSNSTRLTGLDDELANLNEQLANSQLNTTRAFIQRQIDQISQVRQGLIDENSQIIEDMKKAQKLANSFGGDSSGSHNTKPNTGNGSGGGSGSGSGSRIKADQVDKVHDVILALEQEAAQLGRTSDEQELYNALAKAGVSLQSDEGQAIALAVNGLQAKRVAMQEAANTAKTMQLQTEELSQSFEYLGQSGLDMLTDIVSGATTAEDAMRSLALQIANAAAQAALFGSGPMSGFMSQLTGQSGGALSGLFSSLSSFITGGRAGGGIVLPGNTYEVNERGVELFSPNVAGRIEPNRPFGSAYGKAAKSGDTHNWYISTPDVQGFKQSKGQIAASMARLVAQGGRNQ